MSKKKVNCKEPLEMYQGGREEESHSASCTETVTDAIVFNALMHLNAVSYYNSSDSTHQHFCSSFKQTVPKIFMS